MTVAKDFAREGLLRFDPGLADAVLAGAIAEVAGLLEEEDRVLDAWPTCPSVRAIALAPRVLGLLGEIYGRAPRPFQTLNFSVGTEQAPHADTVHFNSDPPTFMCGVWVALEDVDEDSGPVVYYPGSHLLPEYAPHDYGAPPGAEHYDRYEAFVRDLIDREGLRPEVATLRRGEAILWAANLLHGGAPRRDPGRTRHSQVTHYFFAGCRYWTPLDSSPGARAHRRPRFVTDRPRWRDRLRRRPWTPDRPVRRPVA